MPRGGRLEFGFSWGSGDAARRSEEEPYRILVIGDFGGRTSRGVVRRLEEARVMKASIDSFDDTIARIAPEIVVNHPNGQALSVRIRSMDDFHPDSLFGELELFASMRKLRQQLRDPAALAALLAAQAPATAGSGESDASAIERLLGRPADQKDKGPLDAWMRQIVAPHVVSGPDPQQKEMQASAARLMTELMRGLLHEPSFQQLEAIWRGVELLVRRLDEEDGAETWILDATRAELAADLERGGDGLKGHLAEARSAGHPIAVMAAAVSLGPGAEELELATRLATGAMQSGTPVVAGADLSRWEGLTADDSRAWKVWREKPDAQWLGLGLPGFLLRLPYGARTDAIESFSFEEQTSPPSQSGYLWGSASILISLLLAQAQRGGEELAAGEMPVHTWSDGADVQQTPCAETWLDDHALDHWIALGLMPLLAVRGRDAVRLARVQSVRGDMLAGM